MSVKVTLAGWCMAGNYVHKNFPMTSSDLSDLELLIGTLSRVLTAEQIRHLHPSSGWGKVVSLVGWGKRSKDPMR